MRFSKFIPPMSIVVFLVLTLTGAYFVRRRILEQTMIYAVETGDEETIRSVVGCWPSPVNAWLYGEYCHARMHSTVLHWAIERGCYDLADWLIEHGADVDAPCAIVGSPRGLRDDGLFLRRPGKVEGPGTPLDYAVDSGRARLVRHLLARGADVEGGRWITPLSSAAEHGNIEIMTLLLDRGAAVNKVPSADTSTPLIDAAGEGWTEAVRLLLDRGAAVNAVDGAGWTPLHYAALHARTEVASLLLSRSADPAIRSTQGETALMLAEKKQFAGVAEILRKAGAKE